MLMEVKSIVSCAAVEIQSWIDLLENDYFTKKHGNFMGFTADL